MNCYFCKRECVLYETDQSDEIWCCREHPFLVKEFINYTWHVSGQCEGPDCCPKKHHTSTVIMFGFYKVKFRHGQVPTFAVYKNNLSEPIFRLPFHPHLTPENIKEKLPVWITFS